MRPIRFAAPLAAALFATCFAACSNPESSASEPAKSSSASTAPKASNEALLGPEDSVTSQEEANKAAEQSINDDNADAELEKLEKELSEGGGGGG